jgi:hypothetical protein
MSRNYKNKVTGSLVNITTFDPTTGEITGFAPVGNIELGPVANITILGGTTGQFLQTDGNGNLTWATGGGGGGGGNNISNGSSSVDIPLSGGNVITSVAGAQKLNVGATDIQVNANIVPGSNLVYSLGSPTQQWKDLYVSSNTIFLNNIPISLNSNNALTVNGLPVVTEGSINQGSIQTTGNVTAGNLNANGAVAASGNITGGNLSTAGTVTAGNITATRSNLGAVGNVTITGGTNGQFLQTDGNGVLAWATAGGGGGNGTPGGSNTQVQYNDNGVFGGSGAFTFDETSNTLSVTSIAGSLTTAAQPNVTSVGTLTSLDVTGTVTAGNASLGNTVSANYVGGILTTAAQPNVTSVGALTGLNSAGTVDFTTAGNVSLGPVLNVHINGGVSGQYLRTDGAGNLSWAAAATTGGTNTQIQFNDGGNFAGSANLTFNKTTNTLSATRILGTLATAAQPNVTSLGNLTGLTSAGNVNLADATQVNLGPVGNVKIAGGVSGQVLRTDGAGNLSWAAAATPTQVANGSAAISAFSANTNLAFAGNLIPDANITYNIGTSAARVKDIFSNTVTAVTATLGNLAGNTTVSGTLTSPVANIKVTGGSNGQILKTDGLGNLAWVNLTAGDSISNGGTNVAIPSSDGNVVMGISGIASAATISANATATRLDLATGFITGQSGGLSLSNVVQVTTAGGGGIAPTANNTSALGGPAFRWTDVYAGNADFTGNVNANTGAVRAANITSTGNLSVTNTTTTANLTVSTDANVANLTANGNTVLANTTASTLTVSGNALVGGNLTVTGNLIYNDQSSLIVEDPIIQLGTAPNLVPLSSNDGKDRGTMTHTFGAELVTTVLAPLIPDNEVQLTDLGSNALIGLAFYSNAANGQSTWPANTTVTAWSGAANNTVTLSANRLWTPAPGDQIIIGSDKLEFVGYMNSANIFVVASDVTNNNNLITVNEYANFRANSIISANIAATGNVTVTGNITANANITAVDRITAANANITTLANIASLEGNIANIVTVTAGNITANGNITGNIVAANTLNVTTLANVANLQVNTTANLGAVANVKINGGSNGQFLKTDGNSNLTWSAIPIADQIANGNSSVAISTVDGPVLVTSNSVVVGTFTDTTATVNANLDVTGAANITGNANILGNVGISYELAGNTANFSNVTVNGPIAVSGNANITGNTALAGNVTIGFELAGNTANLASLGLSGSLTVANTGNVTLGNVANLKIFGGSNNQYLRTNGNGVLTWSSGGGGGGSPGGANTAVQYNIDGVFAGDEANFAYDDTTANLSVLGNINTGNAFISASLPAGPNVSVNDAFRVLPANIPNATTSWFLPDQSANQYQLLTVDGAYIIDGNIYDYYDVNGNIEFTGNVVVTRNLASESIVTGAVTAGVITRTGYSTGEVIRTIALQQTGFAQAASTAITGTTPTVIATYSYTPVSNSSRLMIRYGTNYVLVGGAADQWAGAINVDGAALVTRRQIWNSFSGGGTRSGTIFPIEGVYVNTTGTVVTITIVSYRITGDDTMTIDNTAALPATLVITEIQN